MNKRGAIREPEKMEMARLYKEGKTVEEVANITSRSEKAVKKIVEIVLEPTNEEAIVNALTSQKYWLEAQLMFSKLELEFFKDLWVRIVLQFKEVLATEEMQVKELITAEILANRCLKEYQEQQKEVERISIELDKERNRSEEVRNDALIMNWEQQLIALKTSVGAYMTKYTQLLDRKERIYKGLKATRDQRLAKIESSKESWVDLIKTLHDEEQRQEMGREMELFSIATKKAKKKMSQAHTYINGEADHPLLTPEVILGEE